MRLDTLTLRSKLSIIIKSFKMFNFIYFMSTCLILCTARPSDDFRPKNVVTVPPNCPEGQVWVNGQCRDVWRAKFNQLSEAKKISDDTLPNNVITVPQNCPPGQQWINGACRDVWRQNDVMPSNVVTVPPNCPVGQQLVNGECRDIWKRASDGLQKFIYRAMDATRQDTLAEEDEVINAINELADLLQKNIINVPIQCPSGTRPDALGICRPIFD